MNKSEKEIESLTQFLAKNPDLRFWQGLLAWAREYYAGKSIEKIVVRGEFIGEEDTFYYE